MKRVVAGAGIAAGLILAGRFAAGGAADRSITRPPPMQADRCQKAGGFPQFVVVDSADLTLDEVSDPAFLAGIARTDAKASAVDIITSSTSETQYYVKADVMGVGVFEAIFVELEDGSWALDTMFLCEAASAQELTT